MLFTRSKTRTPTLAVLALAGLVGCAADADYGEDGDIEVDNSVAAADFVSGFESEYETDAEAQAALETQAAAPKFVANVPALRALWEDGGERIRSVQDTLRVNVRVGPTVVRSNTHLFGSSTAVNLIPWDDGTVNYEEDDRWQVEEREVSYGNGSRVRYRGDQIIANYFPPGEIGFAIFHHRPQNRVLDVTAAGANIHEEMKLQDSHISLVIGVQRMSNGNLVDGMVTLNNPQGLLDGRLGDPEYPVIFVQPTYPTYLRNKRVGTQLATALFRDNIRTMMLGFNAVSDFPSSYNGGDPLAVNSLDALRTATANMVKAIAGDATAVEFFQQPANLIYCAELGFVAMSAGMHFPLNEETFVRGNLVTQTQWNAFKAELDKHNAGEVSRFDSLNENGLAHLVRGTLAPSALRPSWTFATGQFAQFAAREQLAFVPLTMADIVEEFMRLYIPRAQLGEDYAGIQGLVLSAMKPGLMQSMGIDQLAETDPRRAPVEALFRELVLVVSTPHGVAPPAGQTPTAASRAARYAAFRTALAPLMERARRLTGPRGGDGVGLFTPPSLYHMVANGRNGALLGLRYVGHGVHFSLVNPS